VTELHHEFKFRDRGHVIEKLVNDGGAGKRERWAWTNFLIALDKAGFAVVTKPVLRERGVPGGKS
jgi:hypothetical protein